MSQNSWAMDWDRQAWYRQDSYLTSDAYNMPKLKRQSNNLQSSQTVKDNAQGLDTMFQRV